MLQEKFRKLDDLAGSSGDVAPPTSEDLEYIINFRRICHRYNIDFAKADQDEREFVVLTAEKSFYPKRA